MYGEEGSTEKDDDAFCKNRKGMDYCLPSLNVKAKAQSTLGAAREVEVID